METTDRATERRTLTVQLALVFLLFVALWLALHVFNPFVDTPGVKAYLEKHLPLLSVKARDLLIRHSWQLLVAALVAVRAFKPLKPVASFVTRHWMPQFPPFLTRPDRPQDLLESMVQQLTLVGRTKELEQLNAFLISDDRLSWWWLNGGAGSGKSRLALEWIHSLQAPLIPFSTKGYDAGLFQEYAGVHEWAKQSWKPRRPTVIVVDNAAERMADIVDLMEYLGAHSPEFSHPVRVLMVERSVPEELTKLNALTRLYQRSYKVDALNVSPLAEENVRDLNRELGQRIRRFRELADKEIQQVLEVSKGLPLFIILALQDLAEHGEIRFERRDELLKQILVRTLGKMREQGVEDAYLPLLALATLVRGLSWETAEEYLLKLPSPNKTVLDRLFQEDTACAIPPIQPDILGEIFLLKAFGDLTEPARQRFLQTAWQVSPDTVSSTLAKAATDFPDHPSLPELDKQPEHPDYALRWGKVRVRLLGTGKLTVKKGGRYLQQLRALITTFPKLSEFQNVVAHGMANANYSYRGSSLWDESLGSLRDLVEFAAAHRENMDVQLILARIATDVVLRFDSGQHEKEREIAKQAVEDLWQIERVRHTPEFQVQVASATSWLMKQGDWQSYKEVFLYLDDIAREFPRQREIQWVVAQTAVEALSQWFKDELEMDPFFPSPTRIAPDQLQGVRLSALKSLKCVAGHDPPDSISIHRTITAAVLKTLSFPMYSWNTMNLSLGILEAVAKHHPDDVEIQIQFVDGALRVLSLCVHSSRQVEKAIEMQDIVRRMKKIVPAQLQQREDIAKSFMTAQEYLPKAVVIRK